MNNKVVVIGAGPAGMIAASYAAKNNEVYLIEKNKKTGRKLIITGKGRCNVTNECDNETFIKNLTKNPRFLYSAINNFSTHDTISLFEDLGVKLKKERGNRIFPLSDKAKDINDALFEFCLKSGVNFIYKEAKDILIKDEKVYAVKFDDDSTLECDIIILATGGLSYPLTGSNGNGYKIARKLGHTVIKPVPSLISLVSDDDFISDLQGLSLKNTEITVKDNNDKIIYKDFGEMIFTHYGLSGPIILSASAHMRDNNFKNYKILIDLKPALDENTLDKRIIKDFNKYINKDIINSLDDLLPKSIIPVIIRRANIDFHKKTNSLTKEERLKLLKLIKCFSVNIISSRPIDEAIITSGGIDVKEINPKTMESKLINGLYFAGEIIDVDAYTGGFNLQIAFSTGVLAGENV